MSSQAPSPWKQAVPGLALIVLVVTLVYWSHFDNAFQFDDTHTIVQNTDITELGNIPEFFLDARTGSSLPTNQEYRPVVTLLNAIDYWLAGGLDTRVFHWHIFLEFILILVLVYLLATELFLMATGHRHHSAAWVVSAFFGLHTATAETINYIIARSDVFSTLMVLIGLLVFVRQTGWRRHLAMVPFVVGCLAKPTALMLAPLLAAYSLLMFKPSVLVRAEQPAAADALKRAVADTGIYFVLGAAMFWLTQSMVPETRTLGGSSSSLEYLTTQAWVLWIYVRTFVVPVGLTADTDLGVIQNAWDPRVLWGLFVIILLLTAAWLAARRRTTLPISFGVLWFFIALVPSSSVVPLAEVMNHHRTFFPYIGLAIATVWGAYLAVSKLAARFHGPVVNGLAAGLLGAILAAHAWGTMQRIEVWHSKESLWRDVTIKSPNNGRGLMNYGLALMEKGQIEQAADYFERARHTDYGNHPYVFVNLAIATGQLALQKGSPELADQAESYFHMALERGAAFPRTHYFYARWLQQQGRDDEALRSVNRAIELAPNQPDALALRSALNRPAPAGSATVARTPEAALPETWLNLSLEHFQAGNYEASLQAARKALELQPDYSLAYNNICSAYNALQRYEEAIAACEQALALDPDFKRARNNLAWARRQLENR